MNRDQRQKLSIEKWKEAKGRGIMTLATGFGKTKVSLDLIGKFLNLKSTFTTVVIVPTDYLKKQWEKRISAANLENVSVFIINTAVKRDISCNLLIADEVHMFCSDNYIKIFDNANYKYFLGLTATLERLDNKHLNLLKKFSVCDNITIKEAIKNKWVSEYKQYKVELNVDLTLYKEENLKFIHHFSFFDYNFNTAMACVKDYQVRWNFHKLTGQTVKDIMIHAMGFMRSMRARKDIIYNHPKKIELANKIIRARPDSKIITFTKNVKHAKQVCCGDIYHSGLKKPEKQAIVDKFNALEVGVLNTCKALDVGADIEGIDLAIVLSGDSSFASKRQKLGRAIRFKENKIAEIFTFVVTGTADEQWFQKSNKGLEYEVIQDYQLDDLLDGKEVQDSSEDQEFLFII